MIFCTRHNYADNKKSLWPKATLIIMRLNLVILLIIAATFKVTATAYGQAITLKLEKAPIAQVFQAIEQQSDYIFWYDKKDLNTQLIVNLNLKQVSLKEALDACFKQIPYSYEIVSNTIVVKKTIGATKSGEDSKRQNITGTVIDEKGTPLQGATVLILNSTVSTNTNADGNFKIETTIESGTLRISYIGYGTQSIEFYKGNSGPFNITLKPSERNLEQVEINAGYYTVKDRERTGSISSISSREIERQPVNNVLAAMQANIAGAEIVQNTGFPGGGFKVQIRGTNSIKQGNQPFYIVDGVPFLSRSLSGTKDATYTTMGASPLANINPNDIESIEVLKDADATAIYGSRGANGVVLITTKRGKEGKPTSSITINRGISQVAKKLDLMNTEEYLAMRKEAIANDNLSISASDYDLNGTWKTDKYTNWQNELIGGTAANTNIQASLSGGTANVTYLLGANYYKEGTVFPGDKSYGRNSGNFSLGYISDNKKFKANFDSNYSQINSDLPLNDLTRFVFLNPNHPELLTSDGLLNWAPDSKGVATVWDNPLAYLQQAYTTKTSNLISNAALSYNIVQGLSIKANFGYTSMVRNEFASEPLSTFSPLRGYGADRRRSYFGENKSDTWIFESQLDYTKELGNGVLNLLVGSTFQQSLTEYQNIRGAGYNSDSMMESLTNASTFTIESNTYSQYKYNAVFARANYTYAHRYIINVTGRRDGSSRFGNKNTFANFGALGAAWIISEEPIFKNNLGPISFLKIRGSLGLTGNDQIPDYGYLSIWNARTAYQDSPTLAPLTIGNENFAWEKTSKKELALEIGMLRDRIFLSGGYYNNRTTNQLLPRQLPPSTGFQSITGNLPATVTNQGWEFELRSTNILTPKFRWTTSANLTIPRNKLIDYPGLATSTDATTYEIGYPLSIKKLYNTYVNPQTGLYVVEDHDNNGVIDTRDQYVIVFVGRKFYGGLQNVLAFGNLQLDLTIQFVKQNGSSEYGSLSMPGLYSTGGELTNQLNFISNRWTPNASTDAEYQKYSTQIAGYTPYLNDVVRGSHSTRDNSFIRLKNVAISYSLPIRLSNKLGLRTSKIFLQGQNLYTITGYKGLDPETQSLLNLPQLRTIMAGIQLTL